MTLAERINPVLDFVDKFTGVTASKDFKDFSETLIENPRAKKLIYAFTGANGMLLEMLFDQYITSHPINGDLGDRKQEFVDSLATTYSLEPVLLLMYIAYLLK